MAFIPEGAMGYDRATTVFSPDGNLYQVEYAEKAIEQGATAIGVRSPDGIILLVEKKYTSPLIEPRSYEKIFKIDDHVGTAASGLIGDARVLVDKARLFSQVHRMTYGEAIPVEELAKRIGDLKQTHTQYGGTRPFGASLLIAGVDDRGPQLYVTHPSGAWSEFRAKAIGRKYRETNEILEKRYSSVQNLDDALRLSIHSLKDTMEGRLSQERMEVARITTADARFEEVPRRIIEEFIAAA